MDQNTKTNASKRNIPKTGRDNTGNGRGICSGPVRDELIDKDGKVRGRYRTIKGMQRAAVKRSYESEQDPNGGWDLRAKGADRA